jgi:group I intron endonuclease
MNISGIYKIQSKVFPNRAYYGSSVNIRKRRNAHFAELRLGAHHSPKLQHHFNKYGEEDLQMYVVLECDKEELLDAEQFFLDANKPYFNIYKSTRQYSTEAQSESSNEKRSKSMTGKRHTEEAKQRMSIAMKGVKKSEEHKRKLSEALMGNIPTPMSLEARERLSRDRTGEGNPMYGKHSWNYGLKGTMSEETKQKMREAKKGMIPWNKGKKASDKSRRKMSLAGIGKKRPRTPEHQRKLAESRIRNNKIRKELLLNGANNPGGI